MYSVCQLVTSVNNFIRLTVPAPTDYSKELQLENFQLCCLVLTLFFSKCGMSLVRRQTRWRSITMVLLK